MGLISGLYTAGWTPRSPFAELAALVIRRYVGSVDVLGGGIFFPLYFFSLEDIAKSQFAKSQVD